MTIFDGIVFSEEDLKDKERLKMMVESESVRIYQSDEARKGRSLEEIRSRVRQGKIAELYLIENYSYKESDLMWHDLVDPMGDYTEVKAYSGLWDEHAPQVTRDLKRYRSISKFKSKWYLLFSVDKRNFYKFIAKIKIKD